MKGRAADWLRQAEAELDLARHAADRGRYEWARLAAPQAAERAAKSVHVSLDQEAWGHAVTELLEALRVRGLEVDDGLLDRCDVFAYTQCETERQREERHPLVLAADAEGIVLARR
jgi:HEPN domain-containing protein